jgi:hypothetical protein
MAETRARTGQPAVVIGAAVLGYLLAAYLLLAAVVVLVVTLAFDGDSAILMFVVVGLPALGLLLIVGGVRLERGAGRGMLGAAMAITAALALFRIGTGSRPAALFLVVNLASVVLPVLGLILALLPATTAWLALRSGVAAAEPPPSPFRTQD